MDRIREFIEEHLNQILIYGAVSIVVLVGLVVALSFGHFSSGADHAAQIAESSSSAQVESTDSQEAVSESTAQPTAAQSSASPQQMYVDVKGAVKNPGVYQINGNMRVVDAIELAGGLTRSADKKQINLAQKLTDQQVIYIPLRGEIKGNRAIAAAPNQSPQAPATADSGTESGAATDAATGQSAGQGAQINLNTADKSKLQELNGIGDKKADQIIAYRQAHGQFKSTEELKDVPRFGDKTFNNLKSSICV